MSNAEKVTWEDSWLTSGERKALRAVEADLRPQKPPTVAMVVDLTLKRQRAQRIAKRKQMLGVLGILGILAGGASIVLFYGVMAWLIAP